MFQSLCGICKQGLVDIMKWPAILEGERNPTYTMTGLDLTQAKRRFSIQPLSVIEYTWIVRRGLSDRIQGSRFLGVPLVRAAVGTQTLRLAGNSC